MADWPGRSSQRANGTLMARRVAGSMAGPKAELGIMVLSWPFELERAKGIEPS
jgi:hypothetical protein